MKVGNAPISWGICEIPDWGPQLDRERVLDEMARAGYAGTELGPWGYLPTDVGELKQLLDDKGLAMAAAFVPVDLRSEGRLEHELGQVKATASLLAALGATQIVIADGGDAMRYDIAGRIEETRAHGLTREQWAYFGKSLNEIAKVCGDMGLGVSFHSHGGTYVENPDEIARLADETDPGLVKLCLDTGHIAFGGGDPVELFRTFRDRIGHVHLKDIRLDLLREYLDKGLNYVAAAQGDVFVALGSGDVDLRSIARVLQDAQYGGWIIVEQDRVVRSEAENTMAAAEASRAFLRDQLGV